MLTFINLSHACTETLLKHGSFNSSKIQLGLSQGPNSIIMLYRYIVPVLDPL